MKSLNERINESLTINESFLSVGLTIIVALLLAKFAFKGIAGISYIWKGVKEAVDNEGILGIFMGGFKASAVGISSALIFGFIASLIFKSKMKD